MKMIHLLPVAMLLAIFHKFSIRCFILLSLIVCSVTVFAAAPPLPHDITAGDAVPAANESYGEQINLGPTGMKGWLYHINFDSSESRQILVKEVDAGSPAATAGIQVDDVILGASGDGSPPANFTSDARKALGGAVTAAEASSPAELKLLVWRAGSTATYSVMLQELGAYSATAPYACPKSAAVAELGLQSLLAQNFPGEFGLGTLALIALDDPAHPDHAQIQAQIEADIAARIPDALELASGKVGGSGWGVGHQLILFAEYYKNYGDPTGQVLPTIQAYANTLANGQSAFGGFGHRFADFSVSKYPGLLLMGGYGAINSSAVPGLYGLMLARDCGASGPAVDAGIDRGLTFFGSFAGRGNIPYGEHEPGLNEHSSNGRSGCMALVMDFEPGKEQERKYFCKSSAASVTEVETGHSGPYFQRMWAPTGAAMGGEEAAHSYFSQLTWLYDLARRWDGSFDYNLLDNPNKYTAFNHSFPYLLAYALPGKRLHMTGRDQPVGGVLDAADVAEAEFADHYDATTRTTNQLISDLENWSVKVRYEAALELGNASLTGAQLDAIHSLATAASGNGKLGACLALGSINDATSAPILSSLLTDPDKSIRAMAALALRSNPARDAELNTILAATAAAARPTFPMDPDDPLHNDLKEMAMLLFNYRTNHGLIGIIANDQLDGVDRDLLYPAIEAISKAPIGKGRLSLAGTIPYLTEEDFDALSGSILDVTYLRAPADPMHSPLVQMAGMWAMQSRNVAEGIPATLLSTAGRENHDWLFENLFDVLKAYGGSALLDTFDPDVMSFVNKFIFDTQAIVPQTNAVKAQEARDAILADTAPAPLRYLKTMSPIQAEESSLTLPQNFTRLNVDATNLTKDDTIYTWRKVHGAGEVTFAPNATAAAKNTTVYFDGVPGVYRFEIEMTDSRGWTSIKETVSVTLYDTDGTLPANSLPSAGNQSLTVSRGVPTPITLTGIDPEGLPLNYLVTSGPSNGTLSGSAPHVAYTSNFNYIGTDSFDFQVIDSEGQTSTATISITVDNTAPLGVAIYEPFDYPAGPLVGQSGTSEIGLDGTWGGGANNTISAGSLSYGNVATVGGKNDDSHGHGAFRPISNSALAQNGFLDDGATLWFSVVVRYGDTGNHANDRFSFALATSSFNDMHAINDDGAQLGSGLGFNVNKFGGQLQSVIATEFVDPSYGHFAYIRDPVEYLVTPQFDLGDTYMVVGKYTWGATPLDKDKVEIYTPESHLLLESEPVSTLWATVDQTTFDTLAYRRSGLYSVDEIRFGASYQSVIAGTVPGGADIAAPVPNPAAFDTLPRASTPTSIEMSAVTGYDPTGVEYYFTCTQGGGNDSGWQSSRHYTDSGLVPGTTYSYSVRTRDLSNAKNESSPSPAETLSLPSSPGIPGVIGMVEASASSVLEDFGFTVGSVTYRADAVIAAGRVASQSPNGGVTSPLGTAVDLEISLGNGLPPTLSGASIVDDQGGASVEPFSLVTYTVTFSKEMDGTTVSDADFSNGSNVGILIESVTQIAPKVFEVRVTPTEPGGLRLQVSAGAVLADIGGVLLDTSSPIPDDDTLSVSGFASGVILYEPFDYNTGLLAGNAGGLGMTGAWADGPVIGSAYIYDETTAVTPVDTGSGLISWDGVVDNLTTGPALPSARFVGVSGPGDYFESYRPLAQNAELMAGGDKVLWASVVLRIPFQSFSAHGTIALSTDGFAGKNYLDTSGNYGSGAGNGIGICGTFNNSNNYRLNTTFFEGGPAVAQTEGPVKYHTDKENIIILKFTFGATDTVQAHFFGEDEVMTEAAFNANAISTTHTIDESTLNYIAFSGNRGLSAYDEIRMGVSFAAVIGEANTAPEWASDPIVAADATKNVAYAASLAPMASDADADALFFNKVSGPAWLNVAVDGTLSGTPVNGDEGLNSFSVSVTDGIVTPVTTTLQITVINTNTNDAPVFVANPISGSNATEDAPYAGTIAGSATDVDGDPLTYAKVSGPAWLSVAPDGSLSGIPANGDVGLNSFSVSVDDGNNPPVQATLQITVINTNDAPVANDDSATTNEDAGVAITLSATDVDSAIQSYAVVSGPTNGSLSGTAPNLTYTPNGDYNGSDSFTFTANDGALDSNVATVSITVNPVNDAPVANNDSATTTEDTGVAITLSATDIDSAIQSYAVVSGPTNGVLSGTAPNLTYTPNAAYTGPDSFTFKANDGSVDSNVATVSITVTEPAGSNLLVYESFDYSVGSNIDTPLNGGIGFSAPWTRAQEGANDSVTVYDEVTGAWDGIVDNVPTGPAGGVRYLSGGPGDDRLTAQRMLSQSAGAMAGADKVLWASIVWKQDGTSYGRHVGFALGTDGLSTRSLNVSTNGSYGSGAGDAIGVGGAISTGTVAPAIWDGGSVVARTATGAADVSTSVQNLIVLKFVFADGAGADRVYAYRYLETDTMLEATFNSNAVFAEAVIDQDALNILSFSQSADRADESIDEIRLGDSFDSVIGLGGPSNNAPVANDDSAAVDEDSSVAITLAASDADVGDTLTYAVVSGPTNGALSGTAPNLTYTPNADFNGADSFTFKANDGTVDSNVATVSITVNAINDAPVASNDSVVTAEDTGVAITLVATDIDSGSLTYAVVSGPSNGSLSGTAPNLTYTPNGDFNGADSFTFKANDGALDSNVATVSITVNAINDAPVASNDSVTTDKDVAMAVTLSATDIDSVIQSYAVVSGPTNGILSGTAPNLTYTPNTAFTGSDSFTFTANDGALDSNVATISITVNESLPSPNLVRTMFNAVSSASWTTVDLGQTYSSAVIIATPIYPDASPASVVTRIRNVSGSSFELKLDRTDGLSAAITLDVSVVAVEEGLYTVAEHGVKMEAVKYTSTVTSGKSSWTGEAQSYQQAYTTPVVLGQVMSYNDSNWSAFWSMGVSRSSPVDASSLNVGKHVGEDQNSVRADETIGYLVIESGTGTLNGVAYEAALGGKDIQGIDDSPSPYTYGLSGSLTSASVAVASQSGMGGNNGSWAILSGNPSFSTTSIGLYACEDQAKDAERVHTSEHVGYIVFE